jgi:hypothetical protein
MLYYSKSDGTMQPMQVILSFCDPNLSNVEEGKMQLYILTVQLYSVLYTKK